MGAIWGSVPRITLEIEPTISRRHHTAVYYSESIYNFSDQFQIGKLFYHTNSVGDQRVLLFCSLLVHVPLTIHLSEGNEDSLNRWLFLYPVSNHIEYIHKHREIKTSLS